MNPPFPAETPSAESSTAPIRDAAEFAPPSALPSALLPSALSLRDLSQTPVCLLLSPPSRCWAEIDCAALRHNARVVREIVGPDTAIMAIVKANGYGHGMIPIARELAADPHARVSFFGVANVAEAAHLQTALPDAAITLLSPALPDEREEIVHRGVVPWISNVAEAEAFARAAHAIHGENAPPFDVEIKVDTGMGRIGVLETDLPALCEAIQRLPALRLAGLVTHLPSPDEDEAFTNDQLDRFEKLVAPLLAKYGLSSSSLSNRSAAAERLHAQNSAGLIGYRLRGASNIVRPGLMLYGSSPLPDFQARLRPILTLKTRLSLVRDLPAGRGISYGRTFITPRPMRVGTLAAGYADGYPRHLSNAGAEVLIRGQRCPVLGRVTMDQIVIDLSAVPGAVEAGEEAVLIGAQGKSEILASELAAKSGTIPWEIFTSLTQRVERVYCNALH